ncbi:YabP/YqfC family sporulation protein [Tannockella kyphosi]|uniref:YabP/YqfC family sporulation protein n=1 Tax=Tannockella kyphosi TaxID=2899121 RepID=UPI002012BD0E|nr:YabP/YqfC family sporulation protein [Tannockella kyphosi]
MLIIQENQVVIKHYKKLLILNEYQIDIELNQSIVHIYGTNLEINYYSFDELIIVGKIRTVSFL